MEAGHRDGFRVACVADAADAGAGDFNLNIFSDLLCVADKLRKSYGVMSIEK